MTHLPGSVRALYALFVSLCLIATVHAQDQPDRPPSHKPVRPERLFLKDVQGTWISQAYLEKLKSTRAPHAAARRTPPLVIKIQQEERSYPILVTNFQKAVLKFLLDIEPDVKPASYRMVTAADDGVVSSSDVTYIYFRGKRNSEGKLDSLWIADPYFAKRKSLPFTRLPDALEVVVNRLVIAGKYTDEQGRGYEFTEGGDAILPERKFVYEVSLDPRAAPCELVMSHREREPQGNERLGFAWKNRKLQLFDVRSAKPDRYQCDAKPFATLTPQ
jgi:hypothetical protein